MGNRRIGRKRLESVLKQLDGTTANTDGSRAGQAGFQMPPWQIMPSKYFGFFDDFLYSPASLVDNADAALTDDVGDAAGGNIWRTSIGGSSDAITLDNSAAGGVLKILTGTSDNDKTYMTALNHGFAMDASSSRKLWMSCRFKTDDASVTGAFIGLASANGTEETDIDNLEDAIGAYVLDGAASVDITMLTAVGDSETTTSTSTNLVDATYVTVSIYFDGTSANVYVNGTKKSSTTSNIPNDGTILFPAIHTASRSAAARTVNVDYLMICQER